MARSRRCGECAVTSTSPITMRPAVGVSRPAISRSNVLLPHPDGPTSTRNSPSSMHRSRWRIATWPFGNVLASPVSVIAATSSPFRGTNGQAGHNPALTSQHEQRDRNRGHDRSREYLAPWHLVAAAEQGNGNGNGVTIGAKRERECKEELVPAIEKRQDRRASNAGRGER